MKFIKTSVPVFVLPVILILLLSFTAVDVRAQDSDPLSLSEQFQELKDASNNYKEYKVVKAYKLDEFWKNVDDTLQAFNSEIRLAKGEIDLLKGEIESLKSDLNNTKKSLTASEAKNDSIGFLGIDIAKSAYNIIVWGIILGLIILAVILYSIYKASNRITSKTKKEYEVVNDEFDNYKKRAQEKQIKLKRELQTEINRVEELLNKYEKNGVHSR